MFTNLGIDKPILLWYNIYRKKERVRKYKGIKKMNKTVKRMAYRIGQRMFYDFESARTFALELLGTRIAYRFNSLEQYETTMSLSSTSFDVSPTGEYITCRATFSNAYRMKRASVRISFVPLYTNCHQKSLDDITKKSINSYFQE